MVKLFILILIGMIAGYFYQLVKKLMFKENEWVVVYHSIKNNKPLYELQNKLTQHGIKSRIVMGDKPLTNALKSAYTGKSSSVINLLVHQKDLRKAKEMITTITLK